MPAIESALRELGFNKTYFVEGRGSIADLFKPSQRCGVYVLHCGNGEYYVGQAVDVTRRYAQHLHNHDDIHEISFRRMAREKLDAAEHDAIWILQGQGLTLRNITFSGIPQGKSDLDLVMSDSWQQQWLDDIKLVDNVGERVVNPELRTKYTRRFDQFMAQPHAESAIRILREYVQRGIPAIKRGEISFWCSSCMPAFHQTNVRILSRINVNWQEVFTVSIENDVLCCSFHLAISPLEQAFSPSLDSLMDKYPQIGVYDDRYEPGGIDQINLVSCNENLTIEMLNDPAIVSAFRLFNLRLMRKGPCNFGRYHCLGLADRLVE